MARRAEKGLLPILLWACLGGAGRANAQPGRVSGTVTVQRKTGGGSKGAIASEVIVYLTGFQEPPAANVAVIRQEGQRFDPELIAVTAGQSVSFPNQDPFFHNVFSQSATRKFDLGQYPKGETKSKQFPSIGVVEVFCNIHPEMAATILVLPNRRFARAGDDGTFRIEAVPPGRWTLYAYTRRAATPVSVPVEVLAGKAAEVSLSLVETRDGFAHPNKFGEKYRDPARYR